VTRAPWRHAGTLADSPRWLYAAPGELRAPWRLLVFGATLFLAQGIAESLVGPLFTVISGAVSEPVPAYQWVMLVAVFAACVVALRSVDESPWDAIGLGDGAWRMRALSHGALLGGCAVAATTVGLLLVGALRLEHSPLLDGSVSMWRAWSGTAIRLVLMLAPAAMWEELIFRGYFWNVAERAGGVTVARWSTATAFAGIHVLNPGANVFSLAAVLLAGLCLGLIRERMRSLPAAWAAHLAWNWTLAAVVHAPVSGLAFATPGYRAVLTGPAWLTGGVWGPEGGAIAILVMTVALLRWHRSPRRISPTTQALTQSGRDTGVSNAAIVTRS